MSKFPGLKAVIFDMDGVLADTEPLWQQAEKEIFGELGLELSQEMCLSTMGLRCDEVVAHWYQRFPWKGRGLVQVERDIVDRVIALVSAQAVPMPGVEAALGHVAAAGLKIALASSSPMVLIRALLDHLGLAGRFEILCSAENEEYGKPHPAVYLRTARLLGLEPTACLAIEDSVNGVLAAKAARMWCVAVPTALSQGDPRFAIADKILDSLEELDL